MKMERIWVALLIWAAMVVAELQGSSGCLEKERMGLMKLWKAIKPNDLAPLPSDCCSWIGVHCSAATGRVESLIVFSNDGISLESPRYFLNASLFLPFEELLELDLFGLRIDGLINQADLTKLPRLQKLSISHNNLTNIVSLQAFANIKNLKYLDLSENNMNISNLEGICDMKNVIELSLGSNNIRGRLPLCIGNLTRLQILDISNNQIGGNIPSTIGNLSRISTLYLQGNYLSGAFFLHSLANNSKLENLGLSSRHNQFHVETETQSWVPSFQLLSLMLSNSNLNKMSHSVTPTFLLHQAELMFVDLSNNNLQDTFPSWLLQNNSNLQFLWMINNSLTGNLFLPNFIHGLTLLDISSNKMDGKLPDNLQAFLPALWNLKIGENRFAGNLPSFGGLERLTFLDLSFNSFTGKLSKTLFANNINLVYMDFSNNLLHGEISLNLTALPSLKFLRLSNNKFNGGLELLPSRSLSLLQVLDVSNNKIDGKLPDNLSEFLPALWSLNIEKNRFAGNLPSFGGLERLALVDLSFNSFTGKLPKTLFANNTGLKYMDFSNNLLHGEISLNLTALPSLTTLRLSNNKFNGTLEQLTSRRLSPLQVFDVSNNLISGILPNSIADFPFLSILKLSNNSFEGEISDKLCHINKFDYLDISHNNFSGSIPSCLGTSSVKILYMRNCGLSGVIPDTLLINSTLKALDLSYNDFSVNVLPNWIYSQHQLQILLIAGLQLEGEISAHLCGLENITIMDLSHNNFNGSIPSCLFKMRFWAAETQDNFIDQRPPPFLSIWEVDFTTKGTLMRYEGSILNQMNGLDVSSNKLSGRIPPQIGDLVAIHALNLSNNRLWGSIPSSISKLRSIESLDLSSNNLSGEIPSEIVRLNFISYFNVSNNNLSGPTPNGGQFSNFDEQNYGGNKFLCGPRLHRVCTISSQSTSPDEQDNDETPSDDDETIFERTFFWWSFTGSYVTVIVSMFVLLGINTHCSMVWLHTVDVFCSKLFYVFAKMKFLLPKK